MNFNYPAGALEDSRAPFNENLEKDIEVHYYYISKVKKVKIREDINNLDKDDLITICKYAIKDKEEDIESTDDIKIVDIF